MKNCSKCLEVKPATEFYKDSRSADGFRSDCKVCVRKRSISYFKRNRIAQTRRMQSYNRQQYLSRRDEILARNRAWAEAHPESSRRRSLAWRARNLEGAREADRQKARDNPGAATAKAMRRHAAKLNATPSWLTAEDHELMRFLYEEAAQMSKDLGIKFHVDHIVPLRGKTVRGPHAPWNLRIIAASRNLSKGNRLEVA